MSRLSVPIFCIVLLSQALVHGTLTGASESAQNGPEPAKLAGALQHQIQQQQQQSRQADIDLTELTPNLEQQLQQAKRLNREESADDRLLAEDAYRYEVAAAAQPPPPAPETRGEMYTSGGGGGGDERPIVQSQGNWFDRIHLMNNLKRRSSSSLSNQRALAHYYRTSTPAARDDAAKFKPIMYDDQNEDTVYEFVGLPSPASIDNHESASRDSLWTSDLLRDLLIAQEAANRVRRLDQLKRKALGRQRGKTNRAALGDGRVGPNGIEVLETREKKRRCKVDPNLGVKNPSFCDTDAYFGAADYSMRDVWDSAGR